MDHDDDLMARWKNASTVLRARNPKQFELHLLLLEEYVADAAERAETRRQRQS